MKRCTATSRSGSQCALPAIQGGFVCRLHGGPAPQVRQKAAERIAMSADSAVNVLIRLMHKARNETVQRQAASDLLDRAGFKAPNRQEITGAEGKPIRYQITLVKPDPNRWQDDAASQPTIEPPRDKPPVN